MRLRVPRIVSATLLFVTLVVAAGVWLRIQKSKPVDVPILMYHRIGDTYDSPWWVTVRDFDAQMAALQEQGYVSILPSRLAAHQRWGRPLPRKPVIITLDDGYLNALENAEPILEKHGFKAVCYLITGMVSDSPGTRKSWEGTPLLSWPEVRAMQRRGNIQFGGHSRNHPNLRAMADPSGEISGCYRDLREKGGFRPEGFCFPSGQYQAETLACVARAKFTTAVTCEDGIARIGPGAKLLELPRVVVMGGWHRFKVEPRGVQNNRIIIGVAKEGRSLTVSPRLTWSPNGASCREGWLSPVEVSAVPALLKWEIPETEKHGDEILELWDNYRVVRLFRETLSKGPGGT